MAKSIFLCCVICILLIGCASAPTEIPTSVFLATETMLPATSTDTPPTAIPPSKTFTAAPPTNIPSTPTPPPTATLPAGAVEIAEKDGMHLLYVPAGNALLQGNNQTTYVEAFWIDETEVTNRMYMLCVEAGACQPPAQNWSFTRHHYYDDAQYADYPVIYVSWNDASAYCKWAGRELPTNQQWEKAARGVDGRPYPWGFDTPNPDLVNYGRNPGDTTKVGLYPKGKSPYGALDMAGNVWEWVNDASDPNQKYHDLHGGSWRWGVEGWPMWIRTNYSTIGARDDYGFRCVRPLTSAVATIMLSPNPAETQQPESFTLTPTILLSPAPMLTPPEFGTVIISEKDGMNLHYVPAGDFMLEIGGNDQIAYLEAFWIDETEITNRMYALCVAAHVCQPPSNKNSITRPNYYDNPQYADYPVIYVTWDDAKTYCEWAGRELPTDEQWEKAARGAKGRPYPWGDDSPNRSLLNYYNVFTDKNVGDTTKVGSYKSGQSPYGALDMAGNVWEWINGWYDSSQHERVLRGGSWASSASRSVFRLKVDPAVTSSADFGFRCVLPSP